MSTLLSTSKTSSNFWLGTFLHRSQEQRGVSTKKQKGGLQVNTQDAWRQPRREGAEGQALGKPRGSWELLSLAVKWGAWNRTGPCRSPASGDDAGGSQASGCSSPPPAFTSASTAHSYFCYFCIIWKFFFSFVMGNKWINKAKNYDIIRNPNLGEQNLPGYKL